MDFTINNCPNGKMENMIIAGDFNLNIEEEQDLKKELATYNMEIISTGKQSTHHAKNCTSKIDFFIASKNIAQYSTISIENGLDSDHKILSLKINKILQYPKGDMKIPNKELATSETLKTQTGFIQQCGTQINIMRILGQAMKFKDKCQRACILFIDFKSAYNNVNLEKLFEKLAIKNILEQAEIEFLRALYSNIEITIGDSETLRVNKGVLQGSVISPALFDIFIEDLVEKIIKINQMENVFAYADDLAAITDSYPRLNATIDTIVLWSKEAATPLNYDKSGILNISRMKSSKKMVRTKEFRNFPIKQEYKYLGVWLNETLNPEYHIEHPKIKAKIKFIERKLLTIPAHIKEKHQTEVNLNMMELLQAGKAIQKELGCSTTPKERRQRIYEKIAHITAKHSKIKNTLMAMKHEAKLQKNPEEDSPPRQTSDRTASSTPPSSPTFSGWNGNHRKPSSKSLSKKQRCHHQLTQ